MKKILLLLITLSRLSAGPAFADQTINNLGSGTALTGPEQIPMYQGSNPAVTTTPNAIKSFVGQSGTLPYIAGHYYTPYRIPYETLNSGPLSANTIRCIVAYVKGQATLDTISMQMGNTAAAGGNAQLAIYTVDPTTGHPTGSAIASTASLSTTTSNVNVTGAVNGGTPVQIGSATNGVTPYAFCINVDSTAGGVAAIVATGNNDFSMASDIGTATISNLIQAGGALVLQSYSISQTFGTWPSLTGASFTENKFSSALLIMHFSSVP